MIAAIEKECSGQYRRIRFLYRKTKGMEVNMKGNLLVGQSGGPTTVINASLAGVMETAFLSEKIEHVYGAVNGIQGVLDGNIIDLEADFKGKEEAMEQLKVTPSMYLGSCRYKLSQYQEEEADFKRIFEVFAQYDIRYFLYIGGNDSMDTVDKLSRYAKEKNYDISIIGIPKTIDNDLMEIDHTPGFGSAAKYIASAVLEASHDAYIYYVQSVLIVEVMGRNAGWLTASAALARTEYSQAPHLIYLPEAPFSTEQFLEDVKEKLKTKKQVVVVVSEGIRDREGGYIAANSSQTDQFGHVMLSGVGKYLEALVQGEIGCKVRSIELNVLQRCAAHISSATDIEEAFRLGEKGVIAALEGHTGEMASLSRTEGAPYQVSYSTVPVSNVANHEKKVPKEWIAEAGNDIKEELVAYMKPLIMGEIKVDYENGIPKYLFLKDKKK